MPKSKTKQPDSVLFYSDSGDPDMLYFSRFNAFDPYLAFSVGKKKFAVAPDMEFGRMSKESAFDEILLFSEIQKGAARRFKLKEGEAPSISQLIRHFAKLYKITTFRVSSKFPVGAAFKLQEAGMKLEVAGNEGLFPEREIKTVEEVEALRKGNQASEAGFRIVAKTLGESKIKNGKLIHQGKVLTAERLRELIAIESMMKGAVALHTITAPGDQSVDCHNAGHGPIGANELIVVDIFPRRLDDGYWGDMTRTFLKGKASDAQKRLVRTVKQAHALSIDMIKPGVSGGKVHRAVEEFFVKEGYETKKENGKLEGFFHALGHGIGLEVHENPVLRAKAKWRLKKGMVVTTEPGLYYRGLGGVRIEDMLHVTPDGNELISKAPYKWQIA